LRNYILLRFHFLEILTVQFLLIHVIDIVIGHEDYIICVVGVVMNFNPIMSDHLLCLLFIHFRKIPCHFVLERFWLIHLIEKLLLLLLFFILYFLLLGSYYKLVSYFYWGLGLLKTAFLLLKIRQRISLLKIKLFLRAIEILPTIFWGYRGSIEV